MLEDSLFASRPSARKPATFVLSMVFHGTLAVALILIPLFQYQVLPHVSFFEPLRPPAPRGVPLVPVPAGRPIASARSAEVHSPTLTAPPVIPSEISRYADQPMSTAGISSGQTGRGSGLGGGYGLPWGDPNSPFTGLRELAGPPRPPTPPPVVEEPPAPKLEPVPSAPIRRGPEIVQSNLIHLVKPEYPRLAVATRAHGVVQLEAVITREGTIDASRLKVLKSDHPFLTPAAIEAVQQWRYRPTLLNGQPVEVMTTITVTFSLN